MLKKGKWLKKLEKILLTEAENYAEVWLCLGEAKSKKWWEVLTPKEGYETFRDHHVQFLRACEEELSC